MPEDVPTSPTSPSAAFSYHQQVPQVVAFDKWRKGDSIQAKILELIDADSFPRTLCKQLQILGNQ
jgi:hypothetical protein